MNSKQDWVCPDWQMADVPELLSGRTVLDSSGIKGSIGSGDVANR